MGSRGSPASRFNWKDLAQPWLDRPWVVGDPNHGPRVCMALEIIYCSHFSFFADQGRVCHIKCHASVSMPAIWRGKLTISQGPPSRLSSRLFAMCVCCGFLVSRRPILRPGEDSLKQLVIDYHHYDATYSTPLPPPGVPRMPLRGEGACPTRPASFVPTIQRDAPSAAPRCSPV